MFNVEHNVLCQCAVSGASTNFYHDRHSHKFENKNALGKSTYPDVSVSLCNTIIVNLYKFSANCNPGEMDVVGKWIVARWAHTVLVL